MQITDAQVVAMTEAVFELANRRLRGEITEEEWERQVDDLLTGRTTCPNGVDAKRKEAA